MQQQRTKTKFIGLAVALGLHLVLLVLLYWLTLEGRIPPPKETQLILVDLGHTPRASGLDDPSSDQAEAEQPTAPALQTPTPRVDPLAVPAPAPKPRPKDRPKQPIQTQNHEESLRVAKAKQKAEASRRAAQEALEAEEAARKRREAEAAEEARRAERSREAGSRVSSAFGAGRSTGRDRETATGQGNQGSTSGSSGSYSLSGRNIVSNGGRLNTPQTTLAVRGRINVRITVDAAGRVVEAYVDPKGTNIAEARVRSAAVSAALSTRFNAQEGAGEQRGIITYDFDIE